MIETGKVLQGRYRIQKQIGQGGMGAVYVATDERFQSTVAIKETLCMDDNYRKALEREARLLNSLKHTALPKVIDHFIEENGQFLVMEYIPGEDLFEMMEARKSAFPADDVLRWADQLLDALEFLHTQDMPVIHRDIKPQNLKFTSRGQIVLLDFGLAKGNPADAENNTAAKSIFGYSRNYASLEQIQGTGTDPRSDLYSLAATLYHMITGTPPEDALTRAMGVLSQKPDPLRPAHYVNPDVPQGVADVLRQAMDLNADVRPVSASHMKRLLRDCDKTVVPFDPATAVTRADAALLAQETQLMGGATINGGFRATEAKTDVLPAFSSEETSVKRGFANTGGQARETIYDPGALQPPRANGKRVMAAAAAGLLLIAGSALALVTYWPSTSGNAVNTSVPITADISNTVANPPANTAPANVVAPAADTASAPDTTATTHQSEKPAETAKTEKPVAKSNEAADPDEVVIGENDIRAGDVIIRETHIETPDAIIDENGVHPKRPGRNGVRPIRGLTPEQLKALSPEQREKIRMMMQRLPKPPPDAPRPNMQGRPNQVYPQQPAQPPARDQQ